jgi:YD repeat-containing protein
LCRTTVSDGSPDGLWTTALVDGAGRTLTVTSKGPDAAHPIVSETRYDNGSLAPAATALPAYGPDPRQWRTMHYDATGRPISITQPDGTKQTWTYSITGGRDTTIYTDEAERTHEQSIDPAQNEAIFSSPAGSTADSVMYRFDGVGHVRMVNAGPRPPTRVRWDGFGEQTNLGHWRYTYDRAGNLRSVSGPAHQHSGFTYDAADRMVSEQIGAHHPPVMRWAYGETAGGASRGRLTSVYDDTGSGWLPRWASPISALRRGRQSRPGPAVHARPNLHNQ